MTLTTRQYVAALKRTKSCPDDLRIQANCWPYPQSDQSHLAIWRKAWETGDGIPARAKRVRLVNTDSPGALVRIAPGQPSPSDIVAELTD